MSETREVIIVRNTRPEDCAGVIEMTRQVYPDSIPWTESQFASHLKVFPEGQFVAVESAAQQVVGMAASLIILWDDYDMTASWRDFTDAWMFTNHDPAHGRTLYGAEAMVAPSMKAWAMRRLLNGSINMWRSQKIMQGAILASSHKVWQAVNQIANFPEAA